MRCQGADTRRVLLDHDVHGGKLDTDKSATFSSHQGTTAIPMSDQLATDSRRPLIGRYALPTHLLTLNASPARPGTNAKKSVVSAPKWVCWSFLDDVASLTCSNEQVVSLHAGPLSSFVNRMRALCRRTGATSR